MKTPDQVVTDVERRLTRSWAASVTAEATGGRTPAAGPPVRWPHPFPLGQPSGTELTGGFTALADAAARWRTWARERQLELRFEDRRVMGTLQELPTHLVIDDIDTAARVVGGPWPQRLARARNRAQTLHRRYPHLTAPARTVAAVDRFTDLDFDLLCRAADWFATHDAAGRTPRQVPIEGLHAKWLNTRRHLVAELADVTDLRLAAPHPPRIHFTYLDPDYRKTGGRVHDSATVGDAVTLPYRPRVVVISENKDTAIGFPPVAGGVSIEGVGRGGSTVASFGWVTAAPAVFYWGDMDADGLEILNEFRAAGVPAVSLLMDPDAYTRWERFGSHTDARGRPLEPRDPRPVPHLTEPETALYHQLVSPSWTRCRRVEQERIPLDVALDLVISEAAVAAAGQRLATVPPPAPWGS